MRDSWFYVIIGGFAAGIFLRSFTDFGLAFSLFLFLLAGALFAVKKETLLFSILLSVMALGIMRYDFADRAGPRFALNEYLEQSVTVEGVVVDEPDERETVTRLVISLSEKGQTLDPEKGLTLKKAGVKILVTTDKEPKYEYGDRLSIRGKLQKPKNFTDEITLREVDYQSYLAKDGIYYESFKPKIDILARGEGYAVVRALFAFKQAFTENLNRLIPEPHASLLGGLIVGAKQSLGKKLLDDFRTVGVIHIVVLSGYNITIIAYFIEWLFSRLRKNLRLILASAAMILFAIMVGASATVARATIMALLVILARATGRLYAVTRALLIAGFFMLLHNPKILVFDVSFQLSFLATVGLIYFSPLIEPRVRWITERWKLREVAVATVATQIFVLPFLLYKMGVLSLVSLPVNLLILTAIPATMLLGFLAGLAGFFWNALALPFAWGAYALLAYELAVVEWFAHLPFVAVTFASFPLWLAVLCYGFYAVLFGRFKRQTPPSFAGRG